MRNVCPSDAYFCLGEAEVHGFRLTVSRYVLLLNLRGVKHRTYPFIILKCEWDIVSDL